MPNFPELPAGYEIFPDNRYYSICKMKMMGPYRRVVKVYQSCFSGWVFEEYKGNQMSKVERALLEPWLEELNTPHQPEPQVEDRG